MRSPSLFVFSVVLTATALAQSSVSDRANAILTTYLRSPEQASAVYAAAGIDLCAFKEQTSGNDEILTASMRGGSVDSNLADSAANAYAQTSIIQYECGPYAPPKPAAIAGRGALYGVGYGNHPPEPNPTPGYAVMVRGKGKFAESIAPRPLTVMPGYGSARASAIQQTGTSEWQKDLLAKARRVSASASWIPPSKLDPAALKNMSPAEMQALMKDGQQRMQEGQKNMANLTPAQQAQAMLQWGQAYTAMISSQTGQTMTTGMMIPGLNAPAIPGQQLEPLAFLNMLRPHESLVDAYKFRIREGNAFGPEHYLLAISQSASSRRFIDLGPAAPIDSAIESFYRTIRASRQIRGVTRANNNLQNDPAVTWRALQQLIVRPILNALPADTARLWFSPDSSLGLVPLAALLLDTGSAIAVSTVPSAYDFVRLRTNSLPASSGAALLVGDVDFGRGESFPYLAGTQKEIADLATLASQARFQLTVFRGLLATRPTITGRIQGASYVHFATHGFLNSDPNALQATDLFRSAGLALSSANSRLPDSLLTADDIRRLDLTQTRLVTLSACDSGAGKAIEGQGLLGFQTAFMAAGARSVLLSLWPVPDDATAAFMRIFYEGLWGPKHLTEAEALRNAQQSIRSNPDFAPPVNWAAWVLVGEAW